VVSTVVTGAAGFVGRHLLEHLQAESKGPLFGLVRDPRELDQPLPAGVTPLVADLGDASAVREALETARPSRVYHLASQSSVAASLADPLSTLVGNLTLQVNLFQTLVDLGLRPRVLAVGSVEAYGAVPEDEQPIRESAELRPTSAYGVSKATQDLLAYQYFATHGLPIVRVRPFIHIGPGQAARFATPSFARQIVAVERGERPPVMTVGFLDVRRDISDVRDMVRAHRLALEMGQPGEVYNLGSGRVTTIRDLLDGLRALSPARIRVDVDPARFRPSETPLAVADVSKFERLTRWRAEIPLEQTLADVLAEWRSRTDQQPAD
jgi:GDP-4-dehydro-6-deoxy-D-mannose reductase